MRTQGLLQCQEAPQGDDDLANKRYVDSLVQAASVNGSVFFTTIAPTSTGIVGQKAYVANTIPANKVITDGTTDTNSVTVGIICEGGTAFYSPTITITTVPALSGTPGTVTLAEDASDKRYFTGTFNLTGVAQDTVVTATSSTGAVATCTVHRAVAGPEVTSLTIGTLPNSQTELKSGDVVPVSGTMPNAAVYVEINAGGAATALSSLPTIGATDSGGAGLRTFSGTFTVGVGTGAQSVTARARNSLGTFGSNLTSSNTVTLNQTYPTIGARTITYPATQSAIKGSETATISATITNQDSVVYSTSADLSVTAPTTYAATKTVTRQSGTYVNGTLNYTITATKSSNGAVTQAQATIVIADAAATATISITGSPARLTSALPSGASYVVNVTPSQVLKGAPSLVASSGTWQGSWSLSGGVWSRTLLIVDADADGAQTFNTLAMPGLASVSGTSITSGAAYTVGGFATRVLTFAAFSRVAAIGTAIATFAKVTAKYSGTGSNLTARPDTTDFSAGFTISDADGTYNPTGAYLFLTDAAFAGSNTLGTLQVDITEAA